MEGVFGNEREEIKSLSLIKPPSAPGCWSIHYEEDDRECQNCASKPSCKSAFLQKNGMNQPSNIAPMPSSAPSWHRPPPPPPIHYSPSVQAPNIPRYQRPPAPSVQQPPTGPVMPSGQGDSVFCTEKASHFRHHQHPFVPYQGETIGRRAIKEAILAAIAAIFGVGKNFAEAWRWPPSQR